MTEKICRYPGCGKAMFSYRAYQGNIEDMCVCCGNGGCIHVKAQRELERREEQAAIEKILEAHDRKTKGTPA